MPYNRGDVVLALFPDSNLRTAKRRPALIVQADNLQTGLAQSIVAMISSNMARAGHPFRVTVLQASADGQQMGLHTDSVILTDNLATILDHEIDRAIGKCPSMRLGAGLQTSPKLATEGLQTHASSRIRRPSVGKQCEVGRPAHSRGAEIVRTAR